MTTTSLLSDIKSFSYQKTLRKTETKEKRLTPKEFYSTEPKDGNDEALMDYFFQAGVDNWYHRLKSITFQSDFVPILPSEAYAILQHWRVANSTATSTNGSSDEPDLGRESGDKYKYRSDCVAPTNIHAITEALQPLMKRIDDSIRNHFGDDTPAGGKVFIKLSSRSPKDSKTILHSAKKKYEKIQKTTKTSNRPSLNEKLCLFSRLILESCCVSSGRDALAILLDSRRVASDLEAAYNEKEGIFRYKISVVVRKWDSRITPSCEFRGFVMDRKLTCLGQYWHHLYFPRLESAKEQVARDCRAFFEEFVQDALPVPDAMLDLAWFGPGEVLLIEVNPLADGLGSFKGSTGLFDYDEDVLQGKKPFEIRLREQETNKKELQNVMALEWRQILFAKDD